MTDIKKYVSIAIQELSKPTFEMTKEYLKVMKVLLEDNVPGVARVDLEHSSKSMAVYFYIQEESFFIAVELSTADNPEVMWVWIQSAHRVYLTATSYTLGYDELSSYLPYSDLLTGWSKGALIGKRSDRARRFTRVSYEPNRNEAYDLEDKLLALLLDLEASAEAVRTLGENSCAYYISVCKHQYVSANAGIHLDLNILHRLSALNLALSIDTYISGKATED